MVTHYERAAIVIVLSGQITRRVAPSTGCSIIIIILFSRMNFVH